MDPKASPQPHASPAVTDARTRQLAQLFVDEPELVLACLQDADRNTPETAKLVFEAAQMGVQQRPQYADLSYYAARAAADAGEWDAASTLLDRALAVNPQYKDALILAARVALRRTEFDRARTRLETAVSAGADYPDVHMLLGTLCQQTGDWERARNAYQRALALNEDLAVAQSALAALPRSAGGRDHELPA